MISSIIVQAAAANEKLKESYEANTGRDPSLDYTTAKYAGYGTAAVGGTVVAVSYATAALTTAAVAGAG